MQHEHEGYLRPEPYEDRPRRAEPEDFSWPPDLRPHMPGVDECLAHSLVREESEFLKVQFAARRMGVQARDKEAAARLVNAYRFARGNVESIKDAGLARWLGARRAPFAWATLEGLKAAGVKDLPL